MRKYGLIHALFTLGVFFFLLLYHLFFPESSWLAALTYSAACAFYLLATAAFSHAVRRRVNARTQEEIDQMIHRSASSGGSIDAGDNAVLQLAARLHESERSMRITNSYAFHELRNRIAIITSKLQADYPQENLADSFTDLSRSVEDLLALSALHNDTWEEIDLALICAMVADDYRKKCANIRFLFEDSVPPVRGRSSLAYSAISNLVDNAIKYGDGHVDIGILEQEGSVIVFVENTGSSLTREQVDGLFQFQRRMNPLKKDGYGIGLSLVKHVAEIFGGFVWVSCQDTRIRFLFSTPAC